MRRLLRRATVALLVVLLVLLCYGVLVEPRLILDERRYVAHLPRAGPDWPGATVALFSDLLGNHDVAVGAADELTSGLEAAGIAVLRNEARPLTVSEGGQRLYVVGLGPQRPGLADPRRALSGVPADAARVVLMHNPTSFPAMPARSAPLALAGHTHCGQIALPGTPTWSYVALSEEEAVVAEGFAPRRYGAPGNRLFVTCGIGFTLVPVRINAPPQLVFFELAAPA